jgi:hypothetical protein
LSSHRTRLGFPPHLRVVRYPELPARRMDHSAMTPVKAPRPTKTRRVCVALEEITCRAAAKLLAYSTGRNTIVSHLADLSDTICRLVEDPQIDSLAVIVPSWAPNRSAYLLDPSILSLVLQAVRNAGDKIRCGAWGIVTGIDPTALSEVVAKSLLQHSIAAAHSQFSFAALVQTTTDIPVDVPQVTGGSGREALAYFTPESADLDRLTLRPWSGILFSGHGRSYCACSGCLCGAHGLGEATSDKLTSCLMGMSCQPTFRQISPRRYAAPVAVLDSCGAASLGSFTWKFNVPSLALTLAAGAPSAVIAADTMLAKNSSEQRDVIVDVLWALASGRTLGEATARLNRRRTRDNILSPFLLLGDPELIGGTERWPDLARLEAPDSFRTFREERRAVFEVRLPGPMFRGWRVRHAPASRMHRSRRTMFVWSPDKNLRMRSVRLFESVSGETEVWIAPDGQSGNHQIYCESRGIVVLPRYTIQAARLIALQSEEWGARHVRALNVLRSAAFELLATDRKLRVMQCDPTTVEPAVAKELVAGTIRFWEASLFSATRLLIEAAPGGLWPWDLWRIGNLDAEKSLSTCPMCGRHPVVARCYVTASGESRRLLDCAFCEIVADVPKAVRGPRVSLQCAEKIYLPGETEVMVCVDNSRAKVVCHGVVGLAVANSGHGLFANPDVISFRVAAGDVSKFPVLLSASTPPLIAHRYGLRAIALLNGRRSWTGGHLVVLPKLV